MLLHKFPDLQWLKRQATENFSSGRTWKGEKLPHKGWPNVILNVVTSHTYRDNIRGPLSLFMNVRGESMVEVDGRTTRVREGFFYISNQSQYYTLAIDEKKNAETFNIHFGEYFVDQVLQSLTARETDLLENPFARPAESISFHNRLFRRSEAFQKTISGIAADKNITGLRMEEKLFQLVEILLEEETKLLEMSRKLPPSKSSTRKEVLKRLVAAVDFIYANFDRDISLDEIASASCLSKFHFLRLFKAAYSKTPGKFVDEIRIATAVEQLKKTDLGIHLIAKNLGYHNSSSFSRMFYNQLGVYPTQLRNR
jgi:AraC family transcriptional regulator